MRVKTQGRLCVLAIAVCAGSLVAQTITFGKPRLVAAIPSSGIGPVKTADINGDGKTDVLIPSALDQYYVYLGDGTGGFSKAPSNANSWYFGSPNPERAFIDVNGDGFADQVIGFGTYLTTASETVQGQFLVALGDGKGKFTISTSLGGMPPGYGYGDPLVADDFNGDGKIDFALLTSGGNDTSVAPLPPAAITVFLNRGNGKFAQQAKILLKGSGVWAMATGDFNGDGKQDLAWVMRYQGEPIPAPYQIQYMYGNGDGTFGARHVYTTDTQPVGLAAADLNGDHKADLVVGLSPALDSSGEFVSGSTWRIATLLAKQSGGFYWAMSDSSNTASTGLELMDLNGDGHLDAIYDFIHLRAGLPGGSFGWQQTVTGQVDFGAWSFIDLPFAPLVNGGLPAVFTMTTDSLVGNQQLFVQLNTSK
jgi:FG-GAP-like repeat